jgi:hypothetical protein
MERLAHWLEGHLQSCSWKHYLGIECPGCGMQRAFIALLRGDLLESIRLFPALIPMMAMLFFLVLHLIFKFSRGALILKTLFIFTSLIMLTGYVIKIFTH